MIVIEQVQLPNGVVITRLIADDVNSLGTLQRAPTTRDRIKVCLAQIKSKIFEGLEL